MFSDKIRYKKILAGLLAAVSAVCPAAESKTRSMYYDVPLSAEVQEEIRQICDSREVDMTLVLAMIEKESDFETDAVGDGQESYGLMQIQPRWHLNRMEKLGVTDLLDPGQNVSVGVDIVAELSSKDKGQAWTLMAYNGGESLADRNLREGKVSEYALSVMNIQKEIEETQGGGRYDR
ncbi:MAG: lytic transglycosylase domain-containing protein [Anaerovoracaceae bacterium]|nr:lytic transglycosylase domain-containing protein [Anaerovoracaceae bacterium]